MCLEFVNFLPQPATFFIPTPINSTRCRVQTTLFLLLLVPLLWRLHHGPSLSQEENSKSDFYLTLIYRQSSPLIVCPVIVSFSERKQFHTSKYAIIFSVFLCVPRYATYTHPPIHPLAPTDKINKLSLSPARQVSHQVTRFYLRVYRSCNYLSPFDKH